MKISNKVNFYTNPIIQTLFFIDAECGGVLKANETWQYIESPGYEDGAYSEDQKCSWIIQASPGMRLQVKFVDFGFLCTTSCVDYVELKLNKDQRLTGFINPF